MTNYQYRYGGTAVDVIRALYAEGGPRRFYRGRANHYFLRELDLARHCAGPAAVSNSAIWLLGNMRCKTCDLGFVAAHERRLNTLRP